MKRIVLITFLLMCFFVDAQNKIGYTRNKKYTTAERDAITVTDTTVIYRLYNVTNDRWEKYNHNTAQWELDGGSGGGSVDSVNAQTGVVVLDADDISDGATTNKFTTSANNTKVSYISITQAVDLDVLESNVATNNAKTSFPGFTNLLTDYGFTDNSGNWNTAYSWGDHSAQGYLTSSDITGKQDALTLTTTGSSGAATLVGSTLNIPQYSGGAGATNVTEVSNLTELQAVVDGTATITRTVRVTAVVDLVNTDVSLTNVYIADGGGSIISSGTGELELLGDSYVEPSILNYQLNWAATTVAKLTTSYFDFHAEIWGIDEAIASPAADNLTGQAIAELNRDRINKAIADSKLLGCKTFALGAIDFYVHTAWTENPISQNGSSVSVYAIKPASGTHFSMSNDTHIRQYPNAYTALTTIALLNTEGVTITGGNIHGDRTTHLYNQYARIITAPTSSPIKVTIGETGSETEYSIPVSAFDEATVLSEMASWITTNVAGVTASVENFTEVGGTGDILVMTTGTPGYRENLFISGTDTSGIAWNGYLYDHSLAHGIYIVGSKKTTIDGVNIYNQAGDGIASVSDGLIYSGGDNTENLVIRNCVISGQRRIGVALNSSEIAIISNNYIQSVGNAIDLGGGKSNTGTSPASGIWFEPYGTSDADGVITYNSYSNRTIVRNNYIYDCRDSGIGAFTSINLTIENNETNNTIDLGTSQGCIVSKNKIDFNKGTSPHTTAISLNITQNTKNPGVVWERLKNTIISENEITGKGLSTETGVVLKGWKINMHNNLLRNIGGVQIQMNTHLIDSKIHDNTYETDPLITTSSWFDDFGIGKFENVQFYNENVTVYGRTIDIGANSTGTVSTGYEIDGLDLTFSNCTFKSINEEHHIRNAKYVTIKNCDFNGRVTLNGATNQFLNIINNNFEKGFTISGTLTALNDSKFVGNTFNSTTATAAFSFESRGTSTNNVISNNTFNQSSGNEALRIWIASGGTHSGYKIYNNVIETAGSTEFIDAELDDSSIWNNIDVNTGATSQTITLGTGGVANRVN